MRMTNATVFRVKMGGLETTDQITAAFRFRFDKLITQKNFPLTPKETPWEDKIKIIDPGCSFSYAKGLQYLADAKLDRPTYEHGIRLAKRIGKMTGSARKPFVIFLHEAWVGQYRFKYVISLCRTTGAYSLGLANPDIGFDDRYVLAGVLPCKQSSVG